MRTKDWLLMGLLAATALLVAAFVAFQMVSEARRSAATARVAKSEAVRLYEDLAAHMGTTPPDPPAPDDQRDPTDAASHSATDLAAAVETIARYQQLFARRDQTLEDNARWDNLHPSQWSEQERQAAEAFLSAHEALIREIRELAERGGPVYPLDFSAGFAMLLPHLSKLRDCARLLHADALFRAGSGDYATAIEDIMAGLKLGAAVAGEPILISQLVRIAMVTIASDGLQLAFEPGDLPPDAARDLMRLLAQSDHRDAFAASFAGEQTFGLQAFEDFLRDGGGWAMGDASPLAGLGARLYASPVARPWFNMDEAAYAEVMDQFHDAVKLPFYEAKPLLDQIEQDVEDLPLTRVLSRTLLPALARSCLSQARLEATLDLTQMGIALEQYHGVHGEYPADLRAIAPQLGGVVPVDPFTGQAYHYLPSGGTFLLYSIGMDLEDDGGTHDLRDGDMVWRGSKQE